jgi:hypothetical protein
VTHAVAALGHESICLLLEAASKVILPVPVAILAEELVTGGESTLDLAVCPFEHVQLPNYYKA